MHPTRQIPGRPGAPGMLPPPGAGRPAGRPGAPSRGRKPYEPRGVKEGPMKGFQPPRSSQPAYAEAMPITRNITITEGVSVKDLAEKLGVRAKDLIARLLMRGIMAIAGAEGSTS